MKKILAILFAVLVAISAISIGIVPAAAKIVDRRFVVDEVVFDYDQYVTAVNSDIVLDVSGYYVLDFRAYSGSGLIQDQYYDIYKAPTGYYILAQFDSDVDQYYLCDHIYIMRKTGFTYVWYSLDGVTFSQHYLSDLGEVILPYLPIIGDDPVGTMFVASNGYLNPVVKYGDGSPVPAYPIPDQSLPRIFEVWQSVTGWIANGLSSVVGVFYVAGQLTLIGTLAVISVGIALIFLLIAFIRKFLFLRG